MSVTFWCQTAGFTLSLVLLFTLVVCQQKIGFFEGTIICASAQALGFSIGQAIEKGRGK